MNQFLKYILIIIAISLLGVMLYLFVFKTDNHLTHEHQNEVYTCPMHPQIIRNVPGDCPICGMTLVLKEPSKHTNHSKTSLNEGDTEDELINLLKQTDNFIIGDYPTIAAKDTSISSEITLPGIVAYDPNSSVSIAARMSGRIEKLYINSKYQKVIKGQKLFELYSPELLTEQQNYLYIVSNDSENRSLVQASKQKLELYGMTPSQINALITSKKVNPQLTIYSPASGIVVGNDKIETMNSSMTTAKTFSEELKIKEGNYVQKGEVVFKLLNIGKVWGVFNIPQASSSLIKVNQAISISSEFDGHKDLLYKINFIETQLDPKNRTNIIRVYLNNEKLNYPIGLRLNGRVELHSKKGIWIEKESMVSIGSKKIVFIKKGNGFRAHEISTGIEMDDFVQVISGLDVGISIAKNAQYLTDSESFIKKR